MTQELFVLRSLLESGRYQEALSVVDELEDMSKQAILRNIESFLVRLMIHLIKYQVENRLTRSWFASITDSIIQISKLNLKGNKSSYYISQSEWRSFLEDALEEALLPASLEILDGALTADQLNDRFNHDRGLKLAQDLLDLTYSNARRELRQKIEQTLKA
ncbi:MAG: DUF29 family protein [Prochlorotrichaceae cyanobacterium]|jgi:hypothetical protein